MFRQRPPELLFKEAARRDVGLIVRVPLASGLLTGKFSPQTHFSSEDHRNFNRNGEAFDKGETFSGVDYATGLEAVEELKQVFPAQPQLAAYALRWILMFNEVSCIIPGASKPEQILSNLQAAELPALTDEQLRAARDIYDRKIRPLVHHTW
jgi:aryl-alcohol dehydrogenase-like predicted oxidoreductase